MIKDWEIEVTLESGIHANKPVITGKKKAVAEANEILASGFRVNMGPTKTLLYPPQRITVVTLTELP